MPRADDPHLGFVERVTFRLLPIVEDFTHGGNDEALTDGPAHVRACIQIGEQTTLDAEDPHGFVADVHDEPAVLRDAVARRGPVPRTRSRFACRHALPTIPAR